MIRPSAEASCATYARVLAATGSHERAVDAVAEAALDYARALLDRRLARRSGALTGASLTLVIETACAYLGVPVDVLLSGSRVAAIAHARHVIAFVLVDQARVSVSATSRALGLASRAPVDYAVRKVRDELARDVALEAEVAGVVEAVRVAMGAGGVAVERGAA